jgi:hypothetical protein
VPAEADTRDHPLTVRSGMRVHAAPTLDQALAALDMVWGPRRAQVASRA